MLDEPTSALDKENSQNVEKRIGVLQEARHNSDSCKSR